MGADRLDQQLENLRRYLCRSYNLTSVAHDKTKFSYDAEPTVNDSSAFIQPPPYPTSLTSSSSSRHFSELSVSTWSSTSAMPSSSRGSTGAGGGGGNSFIDTDLASVVESMLMSRVVPVLCIIGLVGNFVTLCLLASHGLRTHLGRMEKFATSGLAALAAADAAFCLSVFPVVFARRPSSTGAVDLGGSRSSLWLSFLLVYDVYGNAVINTFIATSSWLTVTLAVVRYVAVCHPLWARSFVGPTAAARFFGSVIIVSVVFNIPRYFFYRIQVVACPGDVTDEHRFRWYGWLPHHPSVESAYWWSYALFGAMLPFCLLAAANVNLLIALRRATVARAAATVSPSSFRRRSAPTALGTSVVIDRERCDGVTSGLRIRGPSGHHVGGGGSGEIGRHVTLTLVVVVGLYLVLVTPAEVINVARELFPVDKNRRNKRPETVIYNLTVAIVNTLQVIILALLSYQFFGGIGNVTIMDYLSPSQPTGYTS